jgi:DNA-binding transcriptional LysR family regulator
MFLDLDQLRTFLAVVDTGSFTAASQIVHKTQSAVSMQMKKLEDQLQKKLFTKDGRALKLSSDGERLVFYARRAISLNFETLAAFDENALDGNIRLGLADDYAERYVQ